MRDALTRIIPVILLESNIAAVCVCVCVGTHDCAVDLARDYTAPECVITARDVSAAPV